MKRRAKFFQQNKIFQTGAKIFHGEEITKYINIEKLAEDARKKFSVKRFWIRSF